jgi:ribosome-associated toxin RatA of RatAB toxin-antitoxin module
MKRVLYAKKKTDRQACLPPIRIQHQFSNNPKRCSSMIRLVIIFLLLSASLSTFTISAASEFDAGFISLQLERAQKEPDHRVYLEIKLPKEEVFNALLSQLHEYSGDISSITFRHPNSSLSDNPVIGSIRISTMDNDEILAQRIISFDPPNHFAYFTDIEKSTVDVPLDYTIGHYRFIEDADGHTNVQISVVYQPSSSLTSFLVRRIFNRAMDRDFEKAEEYLNSLAN